MDEYRLMDLVYDKLADNDEREQFDVGAVEDMCVANDWQADGAPKIAIVIDGVEYVLSVKANKNKNEREFYD